MNEYIMNYVWHRVESEFLYQCFLQNRLNTVCYTLVVLPLLCALV